MSEELLIEALETTPIVLILLFAWLRSDKRLNEVSERYIKHLEHYHQQRDIENH